jgi:DNA-directed RNA polymerase subunit RPC12/RpoP
MGYNGRRAVSAELEDTVYACGRCGAELVRTSMRKMTKSDAAAA